MPTFWEFIWKTIWEIICGVIIVTTAATGGASASQPVVATDTIEVLEVPLCHDTILEAEVEVEYTDMKEDGKIFRYRGYNFEPSSTLTLHEGDQFSVETTQRIGEIEPSFIITSTEEFKIRQIYTSSGGGGKLHRSDQFFTDYYAPIDSIKLSNDAIIMSNLEIFQATAPVYINMWPAGKPVEQIYLPVSIRVCS